MADERFARSVALAILAATLVSGCSNTAGTGHVTVGATAAPTSGIHISGAVLSQRVMTAARSAGSVQFHVNGGTGGSGSGLLDMRHGDLRASLTLKDGRKSIRAVVLPRVTYLASGQTIHGKHWVRVDQPAHQAVFRQTRAEMVAGLVTIDPTFQARAWALAGTFTAGETANLGPEMATEYDSTIAESTMESVVPAEARKAFRGTDKGSDQAILRVWLNERSLPLKIEMSWTEGTKHLTQTVTYTNWHTAAVVKIPRSSDVLTGKF